MSNYILSRKVMLPPPASYGHFLPACPLIFLPQPFYICCMHILSPNGKGAWIITVLRGQPHGQYWAADLCRSTTARDLLKSPLRCGPIKSPSHHQCKAWIVTMIPDWIGANLLRASAIGAKQFVVQEAAEMIVSEAFNVSWFVL